MWLRPAIALAVASHVASHAVSAAGPARAAAEVRQIGDDARVTVEADGSADVVHRLRWRVNRGALHRIDVAGVQSAAAVDPDVSIVADDGRAIAGHAARADDEDGVVRVTVDDERGLARGDFTFEVRWHVDLVAAHALTHDGVTWKLALPAPPAADGFDGARTLFDLPAAPLEPRPIAPETGAVDDSAVSTLKRTADRDLLEVVQPHVARGESVVWSVRVDPHVLSRVPDPRARASSGPASASRASGGGGPERGPGPWGWAALAALGAAFAGLILHKGRAFEALCAAGERAATWRERRDGPLGLVPLPAAARAVAGGIALAAALALQGSGEPTASAAFLSLAVVVASSRAPRCTLPVRGPGKWLVLRPDDAFAPAVARSHWLDVGSSAGRRTAILLALAVALAATLARHAGAAVAWLVALDASALVPLLVTGLAAQLPPDLARSGSRWLSKVFERLRAVAVLRVVPWGRVALGARDADELRLLVLPRVAMPGVLGLEVGLAWSRTPVCWVPTPEVLARVLDGSAAALRLASVLPAEPAVFGRRPDERVLRLVPRAPDAASTVCLVRALADALTDRRGESAGEAWGGAERRRRRDAAAEPAARSAAA